MDRGKEKEQEEPKKGKRMEGVKNVSEKGEWRKRRGWKE